MRKRNSVNKLGMKSSHRKSVLRNQLSTLINSGKLTTTTVKTKIVRGELESLIEDIKSTEDKLQLRRNLLSEISNVKVVEKLIKYVANSDAKVNLVKVGFRKGNNAEVSQLTLSQYEKVFAVKGKKASAAKAVASAEKSVESKDAKAVVKDNENVAQKITKTLTQTFTGRKERSRSRSGL